MEAISVPRPPRFVPITRETASSVKPESSSAAGTFESTWLAAMLTGTSRPASTPRRKSLNASMRPKLPMNTKKPANVKSSA